MSIFPTGYTDKTTLVDEDKVFGYDSESVTPEVDWNKNFTIWSIRTQVLDGADTDDIAEWSTNLYYTEARVDANSTVVDLWTDKADKTNVLELDNTTPFTPDADYEPATYKYVNDKFSTYVPQDATESQKWVVELISDTEYLNWWDTTRAVTWDNIRKSFVDQVIDFSWSAWVTTVTITHWLWKVPRNIIAHLDDTDSSELVCAWYATYDWTTITQKCYSNTSTTPWYRDSFLVESNNVWNRNYFNITAISSTTVTLTFYETNTLADSTSAFRFEFNS